MKKTTLYLIRHGHTIGGDDMRYKGHIDVELSEQGVEQIKKLSEELSKNKTRFVALYCSDLKRAKQSAEILANRLNVNVTEIPEFRERSFGKWEGLSLREIISNYPSEFENWKKNPVKFSPPSGESTLEVKDRTLKAINILIEKHLGESFAVVSHGGVNRILICHFLGVPLQNIFKIEQNYGCLNIIDIYPDGIPVIRLINGVLFK